MSRHRFTAALVALALPGALYAAGITPTHARPGDALAMLPKDGSRSAWVTLETGPGTTSRFLLRDSGTLPRALMRRFPGLRSFRGTDDAGRTARVDVSPSGMRASIRSGDREWLVRPGTGQVPLAGSLATPAMASPPSPVDPGERLLSRTMGPAGSGGSGGIRYDFRLAVAASSRYVAQAGGTVASALAEIAHAVNRANEVFETDVGVHFTLADRNDRIIRADPAHDPFETDDPAPAAAELIERYIGAQHHDVGHALTTLTGGESETGTSCSDDLDADFHATHKAAAWSGAAHPFANADAVGYMIHVLGRQLGAWPTANGCLHATLDDRAVEPGSGSTLMGFAATGCGGDEQALQPASDLYFHAINIDQMHAWLASRGGRCASKRLNPVPAPWLDPSPMAATVVVPARTPFVLEASAPPTVPGQRLTYTWEQMDSGTGQPHALEDDGQGPLFRSFAPVTTPVRTFPRMAAVLGHEPAGPGEHMPMQSRRMHFRLTVRDNGGDAATVAGAERRVQVIDTGRAFAVTSPAAGMRSLPGSPLRIRWDIAATTEAPVSCHFVAIDLSVDGGTTWLPEPLAFDERNDGDADVVLPDRSAERARIRVRCDGQPFFAVSPGDFTIG